MTAFADYEAAVARARKRHPEWRPGQTAFNVLLRLHPDLSKAVMETPLDPFYQDERLPAFLGWVERCMTTDIERRAMEEALLRNIRVRLPELRALLDECDRHWGSEDLVYRFYHQSFKVYEIQELTTRIVAALESLLPGRLLNGWFMSIVDRGMHKTFRASHNKRWLLHTRPLLEAYWHARYMLGMAVRYGEELASLPEELPSGWACRPASLRSQVKIAC
jgi:hypothetical protein